MGTDGESKKRKTDEDTSKSHKKDKKRKTADAEDKGEVPTGPVKTVDSSEVKSTLSSIKRATQDSAMISNKPKAKTKVKKKKGKSFKTGGKNNKRVPQESQTKLPKALEYLMLWKTNREAWSFNKTYQTCLLQNIYDQEKVLLLQLYCIGFKFSFLKLIIQSLV